MMRIHSPITEDKKTFWSLFKAKKNIIDADSDDKSEMNNVAPVPTSSEMRNTMKRMRSYLDAYSNAKRLIFPTSRACEETQRTDPCISLWSKVSVVRMFLKQEQRGWVKIECARARTARQCPLGLQEACGESG
ncbi:hypothetical protein TNCV_1834261 [Trichonephila clavipes]|nr:hypothetical protein TNCV_1834261 [Trichonephila clavipes]